MRARYAHTGSERGSEILASVAKWSKNIHRKFQVCSYHSFEVISVLKPKFGICAKCPLFSDPVTISATNYFSHKWIYGQNGWLLGSAQVTVSTVALTKLTSSVCSAWWCWHTCRRCSRHRVDFHRRSTRKGWGWFAETGGTPVCSRHPHCQTQSPAGMLRVWVRNLGMVIFVASTTTHHRWQR